MAINRKFSGLVDLENSPQFHVNVRAFQKTLGNAVKGRNGRGTGRWSKSRAFRPGGSLVLTGIVLANGFPLPSTWRDQTGTITLQYHTGLTDALSVRVDQVTFGLDKDELDKWRVTLTCEILASPTLAGWGGTQPAATTPTASNQELYDGLAKTHDPKGLQDAASRLFDVWPMGDTDSAERQAIADIIAVAASPFPGAKVKFAQLLPGRDSDAGSVSIQYAYTDTEEDVVNPATATTLDPEGLTSQATAAGVFAPPVDPGGDFVARESTTQELHDGATLTRTSYGLLDTRESIEFPGTVTGNDPYDLVDQATITTVHDTAATPADPTAPLGQLVERQTVQLNRIRWQTTWKYANLNSEQRIEFPAAELNNDPSDLEDTDRQSDVTDSSTPPATPASRFAGGVLRSIRSQRQGGTPEKWLHVWEFGRRTTEQDITFPGTVESEDVSRLDDEATVTLISSAGQPDTPDPPIGQYVGVSAVQLTDAGKWKYTFRYGNTTNAQKLTFPKSPIEDDPSDLTDRQSISSLTSSSTAPATPTPTIADLKLRRRETVRVAGTPEQWLHTFFFARNNEEDEVEIRGAFTTTDVNDLDETAVIRSVTNSATPPATPAAPVGQLVDVTTEPLTVASGAYTGYWVHTFKYGPTTRLQNIEFDGDLLVDPSTIADADVIPVVSNSSTAPATPTPRTADLKLRRRRTRRIQGTPEKWVHTFEFARNTEEDEREHKQRKADADNFGITERIPVLHTSETSSPGTPTQIGTTSNLVGTDVERLCVPSGAFTGLWMWTFSFGTTTRKQEIEQEGDVAADPALLEDDDTQTLTNASSTPPATPTVRIAGQVLARRISRKLQNTPEKWRHQFQFAYRTSAGKLVADRTETHADPSALESTAVTAAVWLVSGGAPATPTLAGYALRDEGDVETNNPLYRLRVYRWGLRTTQQDVEYLKTVDTAEAGNIERKSVFARITASATPDDTGLNPDATNLSLYTSDTNRLTSGKYAHFFEYRPLTALQAMTARFEETEVDPSNLKDETARVLYNTTSTPDAVPSVTDRTHYRTTVTRVGKAKYRYVYYYRYRTTEQELEADKSRLLTDVSDLATEQTTADVFLAASPPADPSTPTAGLVLVDKVDLPTPNPLYTLRVYRWGKLTRAQEIEHENTVARFEAIDGGKYSITTVETCVSGDTPFSLGTTAFDVLKANAEFDWVEYKKLTPTRARKTVAYQNAFKIIRARMIGGKYPVQAILFGATVMVWLQRKINRGGGIWEFEVSEQSLHVNQMDFTLKRRFSAATAPVHFELTGTRNWSSFLGLPAGSVSFVGADPYSNLAVASPRAIEMSWQLRYSSLGIYDDFGIRMGWHVTDADLSGVSQGGWVAASTFGWSRAGPLPGANYDVLLA